MYLNSPSKRLLNITRTNCNRLNKFSPLQLKMLKALSETSDLKTKIAKAHLGTWKSFVISLEKCRKLLMTLSWMKPVGGRERERRVK